MKNKKINFVISKDIFEIDTYQLDDVTQFVVYIELTNHLPLEFHLRLKNEIEGLLKKDS